MEMPERRPGYSLLSQFPDEPAAAAVALDWLQRQSSGSSVRESSMLGDCYPPPTLSTVCEETAIGSSSPNKSWAQQAEETYQLQLALALRLCSEAASAADPNFLDAGDQLAVVQNASAKSLSHRFWVNGCLSYYDKILDGFYLIRGMDPLVWTLCTDVQIESRIPSIESLRTIQPIDSSIEVAVIDRLGDYDLRQLQKTVLSISYNHGTRKDVIDKLARLVCTQMGGVASDEESELLPRWKDCSEFLKASSGSVVFPLGKLSVGLCRHRALLFKMLADTINLPCRVAKGCKYCKSNDASSCLVLLGPEREFLIDLIRNPGSVCEPDSLLNGLSSILISSPLHIPKFKMVGITDNLRSLAKQYFLVCQSLNLMFRDASAGGDAEVSQATQPHAERVAQPDGQDGNLLLHELHNPSQNVVSSEQILREQSHVKQIAQVGHLNVSPSLAFSDSRAEKNNDLRFIKEHHFGQTKPTKDTSLAMDDLMIPWRDLVLKEKIGAGSFGIVHRADWNDSQDVAVKILMEQDNHPECLKEFLREVAIMRSLRHPNIVLLMGAVTQPPNLAIVTEYLSRGSLYRLLHRPDARENLDEKCRLNMAFDVAKGMNYLHQRNPPIVHRDLKSPNLLVDKEYTVKVGDFGLSRLKENTFLCSRTAAGTPEWMAPEIFRDELSNEKSDVYSFGVILWELMSLQQPWSNLNPAQVVAAVGFKGRRLEIPSDVDPRVAGIIKSCWANEPWKRPSFASIMESLKPLIKISNTTTS
uniref:non-specific serine/threonine protein kinase n=1 Tax=Elaeis guineensis var. tenera TaxID=51953 RepID=A0A8N4F146_ELAGV|nr:serine/threonine-protein kinase CTR1 isoform X1 [Elaeis guineensis]XP_029118351.1 serine/threonine-protein kinase CTR1 isoform X1 [Elaeis guineensis]XP_029118352.1 serine/threonine-protein kinase CTR1 isoform X1 [Elaeis guineensis]